jgi:aminoglycoside N3'-acetyltransferase
MDNLNSLIATLQLLGITASDSVLLEAPRLDPQVENFQELHTVLKQLLGERGTLIVPTCTHHEGVPKPTFDPQLSPSEMGAFSEFFRRQPGVLRSHSPTHSVAAFGATAQAITAGHRTAFGRPTPWGEGSFGHNSPWDVLAEQNAWWVMLNADWQASPFTAYVRALYAERHQGITKETPFPKFDAAMLSRALAESNLLRQTTWNSRPLIAFRIASAVQRALEILEQEPHRLAPDEQFRAWLNRVSDIRQHGYLQAGTAKAVITPPLPSSRWDGKPLTGIYRDLYARVLVLQRGTQQVALVSCDLLGLAKHLTDQIREAVHRRTGFARDAIMIACTHTHSTPDTVGSGNEDARYLDALVNTIADAIGQAIQYAQPARLGWNRVPIRGLAQSRRIKMKDGRVFTTRYGVPSTWRVDPELIASHGAMDPDLTVIRVEDLSGQVRAVVANFGCHPSVALMSPNISGDYAGEAMHALERALGDSTVALFTNGTAADIDPTREMPFWGPRTDPNALRLGRLFAAQVLECLERVPISDHAEVSGARQSVALPVRADWLKMIETEQARLRQEFAAVNTQNPIISSLLQNQVVHTEVQALRLNDLILIGLPGEVFTTTGLDIKATIPERKACIVETANDYAGYLLTPEAAQEGGYETGLHFYTRVTPEAEQILLDAVARLTIA